VKNVFTEPLLKGLKVMRTRELTLQEQNAILVSQPPQTTVVRGSVWGRLGSGVQSLWRKTKQTMTSVTQNSIVKTAVNMTLNIGMQMILRPYLGEGTLLGVTCSATVAILTSIPSVVRRQPQGMTRRQKLKETAQQITGLVFGTVFSTMGGHYLGTVAGQVAGTVTGDIFNGSLWGMLVPPNRAELHTEMYMQQRMQQLQQQQLQQQQVHKTTKTVEKQAMTVSNRMRGFLVCIGALAGLAAGMSAVLGPAVVGTAVAMAAKGVPLALGYAAYAYRHNSVVRTLAHEMVYKMLPMQKLTSLVKISTDAFFQRFHSTAEIRVIPSFIRQRVSARIAETLLFQLTFQQLVNMTFDTLSRVLAREMVARSVAGAHDYYQDPEQCRRDMAERISGARDTLMKGLEKAQRTTQSIRDTFSGLIASIGLANTGPTLHTQQPQSVNDPVLRGLNALLTVKSTTTYNALQVGKQLLPPDVGALQQQQQQPMRKQYYRAKTINIDETLNLLPDTTTQETTDIQKIVNEMLVQRPELKKIMETNDWQKINSLGYTVAKLMLVNKIPVVGQVASIYSMIQGGLWWTKVLSNVADTAIKYKGDGDPGASSSVAAGMVENIAQATVSAPDLPSLETITKTMTDDAKTSVSAIKQFSVMENLIAIAGLHPGRSKAQGWLNIAVGDSLGRGVAKVGEAHLKMAEEGGIRPSVF
jgi:uncharacterized protein YcfJ